MENSNPLTDSRTGQAAIRFNRRNYDMDLAMAVYFLDRNGDPTHYAKPIEMVPLNRNDYADHTCAFFPDYHCSLAQRMMDDLWSMGIRPTDHGSEGQLAALQAHLKDAIDVRTDFSVMASKSQELVDHALRQLVDNDTRV